MEFHDMVGKTLEEVVEGGDYIIFYFTDGTACKSEHRQDCCESVGIDRVEGDLANIIGSPILAASEDFDSDTPPDREYWDSFTWTNQEITTEKGTVKFIWLGESNGYYGETPYFSITHGKKV